ncbi:MAG: prolyl oligopeptidase family protein [Flavobacteriales bacterium]
MKNILSLCILIIGITHTMTAQEDKFLWLEEVDSKESLEFVTDLNGATEKKLMAEESYESIYHKGLAIYNSAERIAYPGIRGNYVYNFWKDKIHVRGIWRRCSVESYTSGNPKWETLLDIDKLSEKDGEKWVYKGANGLYPNYDRFLIQLSKGGGDAIIIKEFDIKTKQFIEDGFFIDESKGGASYIDKNTLLVGSDFGEGTMTTSGYPNQVRVWKRGTPLESAELIYEGNITDVGTWGGVVRDGDKAYISITQATTFYTSKKLVWENEKIIKLNLPEDAQLSGVLNNQLLVELKSDWKVKSKVYNTGTLLSLNMVKMLKNEKEISVVLQPDEFSSISGISTTKDKLLINVLSNVTGQLWIYSFENGTWKSRKVDAPDFGSISIAGTSELNNKYFFDFENFLTPSTLYYADAEKNTFKPFKSLPEFFDASAYEITQFKAKSKDGTLVPYFMVSSKNMKKSGTNPTLVYAYGGFEVSISPYYAATYGVSWLENGGVMVLANIRGGGEYGPKWHQGGLKEKRQNVFDDLYAVTEDLIAKKITSPNHLGVMGGSNGGLLVGVAFTQRPDLYNAVVCQVPLLDMKRFNKLLAGASWMGEYGNPDVPEEWKYISKYSPYHNLNKDTDYPEVFFYTSTRDDRVHPAHARKMAAKMQEMGHAFYYYENMEGGHAGSSTNEQRAHSNAMTFAYLLKKLR